MGVRSALAAFACRFRSSVVRPPPPCPPARRSPRAPVPVEAVAPLEPHLHLGLPLPLPLRLQVLPVLPLLGARRQAGRLVLDDLQDLVEGFAPRAQQHRVPVRHLLPLLPDPREGQRPLGPAVSSPSPFRYARSSARSCTATMSFRATPCSLHSFRSSANPAEGCWAATSTVRHARAPREAR